MGKLPRMILIVEIFRRLLSNIDIFNLRWRNVQTFLFKVCKFICSYCASLEHVLLYNKNLKHDFSWYYFGMLVHFDVFRFFTQL